MKQMDQNPLGTEIVSSARPLLPSLDGLPFELDQKLIQALLSACTHTQDPYDSEVFHALNRLNVVSTRVLNIDEKAYTTPIPSALVLHERSQPSHDPRAVHPSKWLARALNRSFATRRDRRVVGSNDFIRSVVELTLEEGDNYGSRIRTADLLAHIVTGSSYTLLSASPQLQRLLDIINCRELATEDYQYILALEGHRVVFRVTSVLDDYVQENKSGLLVPARASLTHFNKQFGAITHEQIMELESLLNSASACESDFQLFFEANPHFFRRWDHREVHPHVYLTRDGDGPLIPDFILTDREVQEAMIVELKLARPSIIRRQRNRDRFTSGILEARTQLLRYRDWFRDRDNRMRLKSKIGLEIYEPRLAVIIGRSSEFQDEVDRQRLRADLPDIEVVTYDDILTHAKRRRLFVEGV